MQNLQIQIVSFLKENHRPLTRHEVSKRTLAFGANAFRGIQAQVHLLIINVLVHLLQFTGDRISVVLFLNVHCAYVTEFVLLESEAHFDWLAGIQTAALLTIRWLSGLIIERADLRTAKANHRTIEIQTLNT